MLREDGLTETGPGIFYGSESLVAVDGWMIEFLKSAAAATPIGRARLCLHPAPDALQHDMLIASCSSTYVAPHRHLTKSESMLVIEGAADALVFEPDGRVRSVIPMGPAGSGRTFLYRMPEMTYHSLIVDSDVLVFVESAAGPFRPELSESAPWAPDPRDAAGGHAFNAALRRSLRE